MKLEPNVPLDLVTGIKQDPGCDSPLDLSQRYNSSQSAMNNVPLLPISKPQEANGTERHELKNVDSKAIVKKLKGEADLYSNVKSDNTTSSGLITDIKKEPQSPGSDFDVWRSRSSQLTDCRPVKEIKMEVDVSHPSCADTQK